MKLHTALVALAAASALAAPAMAEPAAPHQTTISHADLDLTTADGRDAFNARVNSAIYQLCGVYDGVDYRQVTECFHRTKRDTVRAADGLVRAALTNSAPAATELASR